MLISNRFSGGECTRIVDMALDEIVATLFIYEGLRLA